MNARRVSIYQHLLIAGALCLFSVSVWAASSPNWPTYACVLKTAKTYHISPWLIVGVMKTENGRPGQIVHDSNGSFDMGPMQINSLWLPRLKSLGITAKKLASDGCLNIKVGAAILKLQLNAAHGNIAKAVGWYHSHTPRYANRYRHKVARVLAELVKTSH